MNSGVNILFYSRECTTSNNLLRLLQNENLLSYFKLFCVDDRLNEIPIAITVVPTMIVSTVSKPLVAQEAFEWVQQIKFLRQKNMENTQVQQNNLSKFMNQDKKLLGYVDQEMGGISDSFAYTKIDKALPHSYFGLGEEDQNVIFTAPETKKIKKGEQDSLIKKLENDRTTQDGTYKNQMKYQQLQSVYNDQEQSDNNKNMNQEDRNVERLKQQQYIMQQQMMNNNRR
jgi:hypothetical protein